MNSTAGDDSTPLTFGVIVPTLNAGKDWTIWLQALANQNLQPSRCLIIDSSSDDDTAKLAKAAGHSVQIIDRRDFNHGATRQYAADLLEDMPILVFLTQDALLASPDALAKLVECFNDQNTGAAYGRQLPRQNAGLIEAHARHFNYPSRSHLVNAENLHNYGIKGPFLSNSFSAYRQSALRQAGGFPGNTIVSEDMYVGARMLHKGWQIAYCADAEVHHSHGYNYRQELNRYFDIGVFFARERWIKEFVGGANSEGLRFVLSELRQLARHAPWLIPSACIRTLVKYMGFSLGTWEARLPVSWKVRLSGQRYYWKRYN